MSKEKRLKTYNYKLPSIACTVKFRESTSTVLNDEIVGPALPTDWDKYVVFADEEFPNGSAWYCLNNENGAIYRIDIELDNPIEYVNSSLEAFKKSIQETVKWSNKFSNKIEGYPEYADFIMTALSEIDRTAFESEKYYWPTIVTHIKACAADVDEEYVALNG